MTTPNQLLDITTIQAQHPHTAAWSAEQWAVLQEKPTLARVMAHVNYDAFEAQKLCSLAVSDGIIGGHDYQAQYETLLQVVKHFGGPEYEHKLESEGFGL